MSAYLRAAVGAVNIYEKRGLIVVDGIYTNPLTGAMFSIWRTNKIAGNIFSRVDRTSFAFNPFFGPDVLYVLNTIVQKKMRGVNIRVVRKTIELLLEKTWMASVRREFHPMLDWDKLDRFVYNPMPHQEEFFRDYDESVQKWNLEGFLLAAAPGAGKTLMGLMLGEMLNTDVNIYISPKNAIDLVWKDSFAKLYKKPTSFWVSSTPGEPPMGLRNYAFHYERLADAVAFAKKCQFHKPMLWLDESHNLNEMDTTRSSLFLELRRVLKTKHVIWASGTPIKAMGKEVIPLMRSIDPLFDKDAEERFIQIFGKNSQRGLDIIAARLGHIMKLVKKDEFMRAKPTTQEVKISIPNGEDYTLDAVREKTSAFIKERLEYYKKHFSGYEKTYLTGLDIFKGTIRNKEQQRAFDLYKQYFAVIRNGYDPKIHKDQAIYCNNFELKTISPCLPQPLKDQFRDARTVVKYVELKVQGEALGRILGRLRQQCIVDMVPYCNLPEMIDQADKKAVIFTTFVEAVQAAKVHLEKEGYQTLEVYGETNKNLNQIVGQFGANEDINPLIATYASLSTAVPLTMANVCIMLNAPFREYIYNQAISRVDRLGQDATVYIYNLFLDTGNKPNISTRSGDILEWCKEQVSQILGTPIIDDPTDSVSMECLNDTEYLKRYTALSKSW